MNNKFAASVRPKIEDLRQEVDKALSFNKNVLEADKSMHGDVVKAFRDTSAKLEKFLVAHETFSAKVKKKSTAFDAKLAAAKQHDAKQKKSNNKAVAKVLEGYTKRLIKIETTLMKELKENFNDLEERQQLSRVFMNQWDMMDKYCTDSFNILLEQDKKIDKLFSVDMQAYLDWREKLRNAGAEIPDTEPLHQPRHLEMRRRVKYVPMSQRSDQIDDNNNNNNNDSSAAGGGGGGGAGLSKEDKLLRQLVSHPKVKNALCALAKGDNELSDLLVSARVADASDIVLAAKIGAITHVADEDQWESFVPGSKKGGGGDDGGAGFETAEWKDDDDDDMKEFDDTDSSNDNMSFPGSPAAAVAVGNGSGSKIGNNNNGQNPNETSLVSSMLAAGRLAQPLFSTPPSNLNSGETDFFASSKPGGGGGGGGGEKKEVGNVLSFDDFGDDKKKKEEESKKATHGNFFEENKNKENGNMTNAKAMLDLDDILGGVSLANDGNNNHHHEVKKEETKEVVDLFAAAAGKEEPKKEEAKKEDDPNLGKTTASFGFMAESEGELSFNAGDIIVYHKDSVNDGWCFGEVNGQSGWFPVSYCDLGDGSGPS